MSVAVAVCVAAALGTLLLLALLQLLDTAAALGTVKNVRTETTVYLIAFLLSALTSASHSLRTAILHKEKQKLITVQYRAESYHDGV